MDQEIPYSSEMKRKILHFSLIILPLAYLFLSKKILLSIILPIGAIIVFLDSKRASHPHIKNIFEKIFGTVFRAHEMEGKLCGASYVAIAAAITFTFFSKIIALSAFTILVISDGLASIVGRRYNNGEKFFEKSFIGSMTFFLSALLIVIIYGISFNQGFSYYLFALMAVIATTIVEARPSLFNVDDNLTVPLTFSIVMFLFSLIWTYQY